MICPSNRRIANTESYTLGGLYPDTLYYIWLAARSQKGNYFLAFIYFYLMRNFKTNISNYEKVCVTNGGMNRAPTTTEIEKETPTTSSMRSCTSTHFE